MLRFVSLFVLVISLMTARPQSDFIIAHRGASFSAPENTVAAARLAWQERADALEFDIWITKDHRIVGLHDATTERTAGRPGKISELTFEQARAIDVGLWKAREYAGEKIPTLEEMLATVPAGKQAFVEIKTGPEIVPALKSALERGSLSREQIVLMAFDYDAAKAAKRAMPQYRVLYLAGFDPSNTKNRPHRNLDEFIDACVSAKLDGLSLSYKWNLDAPSVRKIRAAGLLMYVWTVDDPIIARRWRELGVDGITTNRPAWLREQLVEKKTI